MRRKAATDVLFSACVISRFFRNRIVSVIFDQTRSFQAIFPTIFGNQEQLSVKTEK